MASKRTLILTKEQTIQKIKRISYEIYEHNYQEKELIIAGIKGNGEFFAKSLTEYLQKISSIHVNLLTVSINKASPLKGEITIDASDEAIKGKSIIVADDVLYSGRTLIYSFMPFLRIGVKKIQTAVLINRGYRNYPVSTDFVGYSLATTIQEKIEVEFSNTGFGVYLV